MRRQRGMTMVEFAIVGSVVLTVLLGVIEFGRLMYTYAIVGEGARRGARLAVVCPVNDPKIKSAATFADMGIAPAELTASKVTLEYLDASGVPLTDLSHVASIAQVRVRISGVPFNLHIPFLPATTTIREFRVTLPRESLGFHAAGVSGAC